MKLRIRMQQEGGPVVEEDVDLQVKSARVSQLLEVGAAHVADKNEPGKPKFALLSVRQLGDPQPLLTARRSRKDNDER
jgi:hypothetical protein